MSLEAAALFVVCAGAIGGALVGAVKQSIPLVAAGLAALLARPIGGIAEGAFRGLLPYPSMARPVAAAAAFLAVLLLLFVSLRLMLRNSWSQLADSPANRALGAVAGGAQAALATWVAISLLVLWGRPVGQPPLRFDPGRGDLAALVRDHNLLQRVEGRLKGLPQQMQRAAESPPAGPLDRARQAAEALEQTYQRREEVLEKVEK